MNAINKGILTGAIALASILTLGACSNNEESGTGLRLANGDEPFITTTLRNVSYQEAFEDMIGQNGIFSLMDLVDPAILAGRFEIDHEAIDDQISQVRENVIANEQDWNDFLVMQGFSDEATLVEFLELSEMRRAAARDAIVITDEEILNVYNAQFPEPVVAEEDDDEEEDEAAEAPEPRPELSEVEDDIRESLIQNRLSDPVFVASEMVRLRAEAGLVILDPYLQGLYETFVLGNNLSDNFEATNETSTSLVARVGDREYTAEDLFDILVPVAGISSGVSLIDPTILREHFTVAESDVREIINQQKIQHGEQFYPAMAAQGLHDDQDIFDHVELSLLQEAAFTDQYEISEERLRELHAEFRPNISARHILVSLEDEDLARELIGRLEAADDVEATFQELAAEYSTDGSAANGGDLGSFGWGRMVAPFQEAAFALETGEFTTEPVESQFGFHIIYVYQIDEHPAFEEMEEQLRNSEISRLYTRERVESILINLREAVEFRFTDAVLQQRYELIVNDIHEALALQQ